MNLASITQPFVTTPFNVTVTDFTATALAEAKPKIEDIAKQHGVKVASYEISPMVLESFRTQSVVTGTFSGPATAVAAALLVLEELDQQI